MAEVTGVGGGGVTPQNQNTVSERGITPVNQQGVQADGLQRPVGQPGPLGQPVGIPAPGVAGQPAILPDVLAGRDPSQLVAAEQMRSRAGQSATDELLGLNRQPTVAGAIAAPPGNSEALRHMTPAMRRALMRGLLDKQRGSLRRLAPLLRRERGRDGDAEDESSGEDPRSSLADELFDAPQLDEAQLERARNELRSAALMLDLLDELLVMQDYAISQMGTFSQG
ncbi:MAG TPA: hypothetical protein VGV38_09285 [Pyrinomonadaceae bacterium]|nr:hypothetical protein [Pyrinomonadaceae bacterium]